MTERKYLPTFADLCDRLSIVLLKQIFIPEGRRAYIEERKLIESDLDDMLGGPADKEVLRGESITAILMIMLANRTIWVNEAEARKSGRRRNTRLMFTHSINGIRNEAKNLLAALGNGRVDLKIDSFAADLPPEWGCWDVWKDD